MTRSQKFSRYAFIFILLCVCVKKIGLELTSVANLPLFYYFFIFAFVRKSGPELTSVPIFLHFVCGMLPQHGLMSSA